MFVTGTDTDVGKTIITAAITAVLRAEEQDVGIWKPVQSGAVLGSGATDGERLVQLAGLKEGGEGIASFSFEAPLTPLLAAKHAGVVLSIQQIMEAGEPYFDRYSSLLIEGAGGVAVPLTEDALVVDLIRELQIPALIVARSSLGTINHTLLTVSYLRNYGIPIVGVILNDCVASDESLDPSRGTNAELIEAYSGVKVLGRFPFFDKGMNTEGLIDAARNHLQLAPIKQALVGTRMTNER
ncbi:dethiobiotin synthase [Paenibacillus sp. GSMTC-2017]|nr:dethiobiotin synthase [Paenibacillus sp. GSMTC-2017]